LVFVFFVKNHKDCGATIGGALYGAKEDTAAEKIRERAKHNEDSQSNGSLMRITPLAVFASKIKDNKIFEKVIRSEATLTHANETAQQVAICYCIAIRELINQPKEKDRKKAYEVAKTWALENGNEIIKSWFSDIDSEKFVFQTIFIFAIARFLEINGMGKNWFHLCIYFIKSRKIIL